MKTRIFNPQDAKKGLDLHEVLFTPKGKDEQELIYIYAETRLDASNKLILAKVYGEQHEIRTITRF